MREKDRRREDSRIISRVARMSLPKRWKRLNELEEKIVEAEAALASKRDPIGMGKKIDEQTIGSEERRLSEMKSRLQLERSEYQNLKSITPDFKEPGEWDETKKDLPMKT